MRIIEKKYMFSQCLYTLIQNCPDLGAVHMSRASPANRADSILSRAMVT